MRVGTWSRDICDRATVSMPFCSILGRPSQRGGTGDPFAWEEALPLAASIQEVLPLIIAGGLNSRNVGEALQLFHPWGVDVVSGVEREPGKKDEAKLRDFVAAVRREQAEAR